MHIRVIAAYKAALYVVFGDPGLVLRIGAANAQLDALLEAEGAATAAFITASNPRGHRRGELENGIAFDSLKKFLNEKRYPWRAGEGRDPQGRWPSEPSILVFGIPRAGAEALGRTYQQNAIVFVEKGGAPQLVVLVD